MDKLHKIDNKLDTISKKISFADLNPINVEEEKEKFFIRKDYDPVFQYRKPKSNLSSISRSLEKIKPDNSVVGNILKGIRDKYLLDIELINNRGQNDFQRYSIKIYGKPNHNLIKQAKKLLYLRIQPEQNQYSTRQIINKLNFAFMKYGFHWEVEEKDMIANAAVKIQDKKLLIKKKSRFSRDFLKRIIVHEIGTHIMRAENGENQPYKFFARGLPGYLMTEEGLAVFNEEIHDCLNNYVLKVYAGRVLAINSAMHMSFSETYKFLRKYFTKNTAWRLTLRCKRGSVETNKPGAFTKDIAYLQGYLKVKDFINKGGNINKLYYGKVGLEHINSLDNIPNLINPHFLPMFRYLKYFKGHFSNIINRFAFQDSIRPIEFEDLKLDNSS